MILDSTLATYFICVPVIILVLICYACKVTRNDTQQTLEMTENDSITETEMYGTSTSECHDIQLTMPSTYAASLSNGVYGSYYYIPSIEISHTMPLHYRPSMSNGIYGSYYYCNILKQKVLALQVLRNDLLSLRLNVMTLMNDHKDSENIILDAIIHKTITEKPGGAFMEHYVALISFIHQQIQFSSNIRAQKFEQMLHSLLLHKLDSFSRINVPHNEYLSIMLLIAQLFTKLLIDEKVVCNTIESILSSSNMKPVKLIGLCVLLRHCGGLLRSDHVSKYVQSIKQLSHSRRIEGKNIAITKMIQSIDNKLAQKESKLSTKSPGVNAQDQMMKTALIKSFQILNLDTEKSTMTVAQFPFIKSAIHKQRFIASQVALKLLFVIEIDPLVRLKYMTIRAPGMDTELYGFLDIVLCGIRNDANTMSDFAVTSDNVIARFIRCPANSLVKGRGLAIPQTGMVPNKYAVHITAVDGFFSGRLCINGITFRGEKTVTLSLKQLKNVYLLLGNTLCKQETIEANKEENAKPKKEINEDAEKCRFRLKVIAESQVSFLLTHIHDVFMEYFNTKLDVQFTPKWRPKDLIMYFDDLFEVRRLPDKTTITVRSKLCQTDRYDKKQKIQTLNRSRKEMQIIAKKIKSFDLNDLKAIFLDYFGYDIESFFRTRKAKADLISYYKQYFKMHKTTQSITVISKMYTEEQPELPDVVIKQNDDDMDAKYDEPLSFEKLLEIPLLAHWVTIFGLPSHLCDANILSSMEWFGHWKILDIKLREKCVTIKFQKVSEARESVQAMHGRFVEHDKRIRVEIGRTYYCPAFLKRPDHPKCKQNCTLMHKWINKELLENLSTVRLWKKRIICVRGLPMILCDDDTIRSWFGKFGEIEDINFWRNDKILAFLTFYDERDARNAIQMMDGKYSKQYRTKLQVDQSYSLYCLEFLTNGVVRCSNYPRCKRMHRWIHANEMIKPTIPPKPQEQKTKLEKHVETEEDVDKYAYDGVTGCIEDIRGIRLQSENSIVVRGITDFQSCNERVLRSDQWFGQFGSIKKISFLNVTTRQTTPLVFVTFVNPNDVVKAIAWTREGRYIDGQVIYTMMMHSQFCGKFLQNPHKPCRDDSRCADRIHKWISKKLADKIKDTQIIQRRVISVEGLSDDLCSHDILISSKYFGRFGQIKRIQMSKSLRRARITYYDMNNAMNAVRQSQANQCLKVSILRNQYCPNFLDKYDCDDSNCLYVHYWVPRRDIVCEEEVDQHETHEGKEVEEHDGHECKESKEQEGTETGQKEDVRYYNDGDAFAKWLCKTVQMKEYLSLFQDHEYNEISMIEFFDIDVLKEMGIEDDSHCECILDHVESFKASMNALKRLFESIDDKFKSCQHVLMKNNIVTLDQLQDQIKTKQDAKQMLTTLSDDDVELFVDILCKRRI
eukprot:489789_1